jgi:hypothetical protein
MMDDRLQCGLSRSGRRTHLRTSRTAVLAWLAVLALLGATIASAAAVAPQYTVEYRVGFLPDSGEATVAIRLQAGNGHAERLRFSIDRERHHAFQGDGRIAGKGDRLTWYPPAEGGELRYRYRVDHPRNGAFVARMTERWALLRIDRLVPPVAVLARKGAVSTATLRFDLPPGWNGAEVGYRFDSERSLFPIDNPGRRFQRPLGWMIAGDIGMRREQIDDFEVVVAAPRGAAMRRNDLLAIVNATALELREAFGRLPPKLLIVGAGDPMWRGGLSGPGSLFLHADRPLISENGTSTLVHELVHVISGIRGTANHNWIAEGIAEYYSIELLRRSGLLSESRAERAFAWMENHGRRVKGLAAANSSGPRTARAVSLFHALDGEIRAASNGSRDLDDLLRPLVGRGRIGPVTLREAAQALLGRPSKVLATALID